MSAAARYVWRRVISEQAPGVILAVDRDMLRVYCEAVVRYEQAAAAYAASAVLINDRGHLTKNPLHQVVRDNAEQVRLFARELGLSPAARAGLRMDAVAPGHGHRAGDRAPATAPGRRRGRCLGGPRRAIGRALLRRLL